MAETLFVKLGDVYGYDTAFDVEDAKKEVSISVNYFDDLFEELKQKGYVYYTNKGTFKLIDPEYSSFKVTKKHYK